MQQANHSETLVRLDQPKSASDVLVTTRYHDSHAITIAAAIMEKGGTVDLWYLSDYPTRQRQSVWLQGAKSSIKVTDNQVVVSITRQSGEAWFRRGHSPAPNYSEIHKADQEYVERISREYHSSLRELIGIDTIVKPALWANRPDRVIAAESKPLQLVAAREAGWRIPDTLISNNLVHIRSFIAGHSNGVVYKSLAAYRWEEQDVTKGSLTQSIRIDDLGDDQIVSHCAELYQERIDEAAEVRVFLFGRSYFAIKFAPLRQGDGFVDWQRH